MSASPEVTRLLVCIANAAAPIDQRCQAADALAELGDPRLDEPALIQVPAGALQHKPSLTGAVQPMAMNAFAIGQHLVTVAAYAEFIEEEGYDDPALWSPRGWQWRLDHDIEKPRFWAEEEWAVYLTANRPVVGVSFFEAEAYATFREARLPSEFEWERACRGDDARDYPWGDVWDDDACGHRGFGPRRTLPIGVFPNGVSPLGAHDMVGNVWQWTEDERGAEDKYGAPRVVRGGAWNNLPWSIGSAGRNAYPPTAQFSNLGFRLAADSR